MDKLLKEKIEDLVKTSIIDFKGKNSLNPKRIILYASCKKKIKDSTLIFNHTQNRFYNQQYMIDNPVPVEIIPWYRPKLHSKEGDYPIDVIAFLRGEGINIDSFFYF